MSYLRRNNRAGKTRIGQCQRRSGIVLAVVLVALLVVLLLGAAFVNMFVAQRKLVRQASQQQQALWIVEAAANRAVYRMSKDKEYEGETWQLPADALNSFTSGAATIRIEAIENPRKGHQISVNAWLSTGGNRRVVQHREQFLAASKDESD